LSKIGIVAEEVLAEVARISRENDITTVEPKP
jgi:hypothetical protein